MSKKILIGFLFSTGIVKKTQKMSNGKKLMPPRLELGTFCVLGRYDNHYTMAPIRFQRFLDSESVVKWHLLIVCTIETLFAIKKWVHQDPRLNCKNRSVVFHLTK